MSLAIKIG